jgi:hypothetical protein
MPAEAGGRGSHRSLGSLMFIAKLYAITSNGGELYERSCLQIAMRIRCRSSSDACAFVYGVS